MVPAVSSGRIVPRGQLFGRLGAAGRVTQISAPAGSGKTVLLRSWIREADLGDSTAWVSVSRGERCLQRFWVSVADALRRTYPGSELVRGLTAAPAAADGWAIAERLLTDLDSLDRPLWLVIDDLHELRSSEALRQLELLVMRSPARLRFVLATRRDLGLGLHRLRVEGELTEIRAADLRFTPAEARALFEGAGVELSASSLALLVERTEGWAAGLRLAALSLAGHPDPERFAAEFSGSERTVAQYLVAEVLDRQSEQVRRLLLRTSVLERVSGSLADTLTGDTGGERILQELEQANAFVVSLDAGRSWFRYHHLFADLLQFELRRTEPGELPAAHGAAASWYAEHGYPVEAIRHAQVAYNWRLAARLLSDHWGALYLNGETATAHELLTGFPAGIVAADAELIALRAADELNWGSIEDAERYLTLATQQSASLPQDRRDCFQVALAILRLSLARQRSDLPAVVGEAERLLAPAEAPGAAQVGLGADLRALALISLGTAELWTARLEEAERHLERGVALAHRIGRPYLEVSGLAHGAMAARFRTFTLGGEQSRQAIELVRRHGWSEEPVAGVAYLVRSAMLAWQGRLEEAEGYIRHAERTLQSEADPAAGMMLPTIRGLVERARGRDDEALRAFQTAGRLAGRLVTPHTLATRLRAHVLHTLVRLGQTQRAEAALAGLDDRERDTGEMRTVRAALRLAQDDPPAATAALAPVLDGSVPLLDPHGWLTKAFLLEAVARDAAGDPGAAGRAVEQALDLAEPNGMLLPFLLQPARELLERHLAQGTAHATLLAQILNVLAGTRRPASPPSGPPHLPEPLSDGETRVLRYLPASLSAPEIAAELHLSVNTVKTHMRHLYAKLGVHRRQEAVDQARALGLLTASLRPHMGRAGPSAARAG
jgi:LuxR family maltose regulon positive regulatory protein